METRDSSFRDRLLAHLPQPGSLADYRKEVEFVLTKNEKDFRRETKYVVALWLFVVALSTVFLTLGGIRAHTPAGTQFGIIAIYTFLFGAIELLKHFINRGRVELLKEVKQVQLQVLELHELLHKPNAD